MSTPHARPVTCWAYRVAIRDHGPDDATLKLCLLILAVFMDEDGEAYPSQELIAEAASLGVSTVRAKLGEASRLGWLAIYERGAGGQRWRQYSYRACVPDGIALDAKVEAKLEQWARTVEPIAPSALRGTLYPQRSRRAPPRAGGRSSPDEQQAPPRAGGRAVLTARSTASSRVKDRQITREAPPAHSAKHRQLLGMKSSSEVSKKDPYEGAIASDRPRERGAIATDAKSTDIKRKVAKAVRLLPEADADTLMAAVPGATLEDVAQVRAALRSAAA